MNVIRAHPSQGSPRIPDPARDTMWDRYVRLPPDLKLIMRLKAMLYLTHLKNEFVECLKATNLKMAEGRMWTHSAVAVMIDKLRGQGLLTTEYYCLPELLDPVTIDAVASDQAANLIGGIRKWFPARHSGHYYLHPAGSVDMNAVCRLLRLAIYMNDEAEFVSNRTICDQEFGPHQTINLLATIFLHKPLSVEWITSRAPAMQPILCETKLLTFLAAGEPDPHLPWLLAHCRARLDQDDYKTLRRAVLSYDLFAGEFSAVRAGIATLNDPGGDIRQALEGSVAFLQGQNETALRQGREALKLFRKRISKRKTWLPDEPGLLFVMALLHANDATLHGEIQNGLDLAITEFGRTPEDGGLKAMQALLWLVQGLEAKARDQVTDLRKNMPASPLSAACVALAEYFIDPAIARGNANDLAARFEAAKEALPLVARIHAEILAQVARAPGDYEAWLKETQPDQIITFTSLIAMRQPWERALESLDALLGLGEAKPTGKSSRPSKRLAWFVDPEKMNVSVAEQSAKGADNWTDGRAVAMKRLHEQDPRLDYLIPQDRVALRAIRKEAAGWYGDESYYFDHPRAIAALVGHPAVFDSRHRSRRLDLVSYPVELVVTEQKDGYRVALSHTADEATVFMEAETPTRYRVLEFAKSMLAVQEILGKNGLTVPAAARDRVVAMAQRNSPTLPVRAEIAEIEQPGIEGQSTPVVQLVPHEGGLKLSLLVRPFGGEGPAYVAGVGGRSVLSSIGGRQQRATRDLPKEIEERAALIAACPTLRDRSGPDTHELIVDDLDGCLELLLELRGYTGPVAIEWPEGRKLRVSKLDPGKLKLRVGQDRDWFSVGGTATLDDDQVLEMRFLLDRLDGAKGRFVPLGDGQYVALTHQLQTQLQRLTAVSEPHKTGRRVHALGAPALDAVLEDAGEVKADAAWKKHVARIRSAEGWEPKLPATLQADLRDYQIEGFVWMSRLARWGAGACLADDMGLGKTVQAITVMLDRAQEGPCLVVAPTSVCPNWMTEIARFAPTLRTHRLSAGDRSALITGLGAGDVLVCSYGLLNQSVEALAGKQWQMVVLDEAQAIKNADTKRAQATSSLQAGFRLALTGTPVENYLDELWSLFNFVNPGMLGSREGFQKRFARPIERDRDPHARQALRALIRPFLLRRTKAAVLSELPPRTEQTMNVEMSETERAFYEALRQQSLERLEAMDGPPGRRKIQILAEITKLRRACCNPALIDPAAAIPSGKLDTFLELVDELIRNRHRALVFSQFVGHLTLVRTALDERGIRYEYLDGSTPSNEREKRVAAFQSGSADLFLISLKAGGTGLNLTAADYVVHLDPWWNPAVEDQASDRAHRIGQERPVTIYRLIMEDSIEERILQLHRDKRDLATDILEGGEVSARLSEEALLDLIKA